MHIRTCVRAFRSQSSSRDGESRAGHSAKEWSMCFSYSSTADHFLEVIHDILANYEAVSRKARQQ